MEKPGEEQDLQECLMSGPMDVKGMKNLIRMLYARGPLIGKVLGYGICVPDELMAAVSTLPPDASPEDIAGLVEESPHEGFSIIVPENAALMHADGEEEAAFVGKLYDYVQQASVVKAHVKPAVNEKYAFRALLVRLGMGGARYSGCRKVLLHRLSGNSAFAVKESYEKFKERRRKNGRNGRSETEAAGAPDTGR